MAFSFADFELIKSNSLVRTELRVEVITNFLKRKALKGWGWYGDSPIKVTDAELGIELWSSMVPDLAPHFPGWKVTYHEDAVTGSDNKTVKTAYLAFVPEKK